jgi:chromosome segregation protein
MDRELNEFLSTETNIKERLRKAQEEERDLSAHENQLELQVDKLQRNLQWHQGQKVQVQSEIDNETQELGVIKAEINKLHADLLVLREQLVAKENEINAIPIEEIQSQNAYWKTNAAVILQALSDAKNRLSEKGAQNQQLQKNLDDLTQRSLLLEKEIDSLQGNMRISSREEKAVAQKIDELSHMVNPLEELLRTLEREHSDLLSSDTQARQELRAAEQQYTQARINLARHQESFETLRGHIEDDFGLVSFEYTDSVSGPKPLPLDGLVEELPKVAVLAPELEETIRQQKAVIRRMGAINPEAEIEYKEVKDRFEFLTSQVADLLKAETDIREVIAELDILMEREFRRTFEAVAQEFKQIFTRLFGGGTARLTLTDPDNMTETGIDIEARLPGRREQGLSLLSGGERSLTATALVFALLRVSPTPFCILDEVDAMLDEANVGRFRDLLTELSEKTQFIVITHNRNTVQAASIIYGVTMGRDSASQVISLRMDELGEEFGV